MNQSRAIVIAGALVALALVAHAIGPRYLPRYETHHAIDGVFVRVDRWTGTAELAAINRPSEWLTRGSLPPLAKEIDMSGLVSPPK